ncbi:response regulator [Lentibacillus sp. N15]|uniref:response regulator n=1 Tax=Lentibacillus songyuanensis TaxID=3136161 RepID=UPI0031BB43DC
MKKLLIVDDEQIEREGLMAILQKGFPELEINQAKNGSAALQMAGSFLPELVLMDIKMPGKSGLEVIEQINQVYPDMKFIMITAYATFDYAQLAMKLGVMDYLVKPSKASEIIKVVGKAKKQIEAEQKKLAASKLQQSAIQKALPIVETDVVTQLLFDHVHEIHLDILVDLLNIRITNEAFVISMLLPEGSETLYPVIKEKIRQMENALVGAIFGRQLPIIVFRQPDKSFRSQATLLARGILSNSQFGDRTDWFIGIGNVCDSLNQIWQSYQESLIATKDSTLPVKFIFYSDLPEVGMKSQSQNAKQLETQFFDQIRNGKWKEVTASVIDFIQHAEKEGADLLQTQQRVLELLWIASRVLNEFGVVANTPFYSSEILDFKQLRNETIHLINQMRRFYENHYHHLEDNTIQLIKEYIIKHSSGDITLDSIAQMVGLSPVYISKLFKERLGINYITFLTECRVEKAKKLMLDAAKSLKEITFEVGYHDPNYFSKVFKKICGAAPTEYRKTLKKIKN